MKRITIPLLLTILLWVTSCSVEVPGDILSPRKMEKILYDYHQAVAMAENSDKNVEQERFLLVHKVFEKHGVSEAEFDSSMVWYSGHVEYLTKMYTHIEERMQLESSRMGLEVEEDVYANLSETGDTAVIWRTSNLWLQNKPGQNLLKYTIMPDSSFHLRDSYMLRFKSFFVTQDNQREAYALLVAHFDNDSTASAVTRIGGNYDVSIQIHPSELTDEHQLRSLHLYFYFDYDENWDKTFRLLGLASPTLIRFHHPERQKEQGLDEDSVLLKESPDTLLPVGERIREERMTPGQLRENHEGEHTINVQKQRRVILPSTRKKIKPATKG